MEWSEDLVRVLNRIGDELGKIRRIMEKKEGESEEEESVEEKERKDDGERNESESKTEEEDRSINGEEWWKKVMRGVERRRREEKADEVAAEGQGRQRMVGKDGRRKEEEGLEEGERGEEGRREKGETEGRMVEVSPGSEEGWRGWSWEERERRKDEKEGWGGVKEGEEGVGKIMWQKGENIKKWFEEKTRRRVGLAGTKKRVDSGDEGGRRVVEEIEKEEWRMACRKGGVGEGEKKASQGRMKRGEGGSEEKRAIGREEGGRQVNQGGKVEEKEERGEKKGERQREVNKREEDEREKARRLRERVKRMEEEREQKEKRKRNVIWRGLDGRDAVERRCFMEWATENIMGRMPRIRRVWERRIEGKEVVLMEMEDEKERAELLERYWEFKQKWGICVDEDLTMEERRTKWRIMEKARVERERGRRVITDNRRIWVDGKEIFWNEEEEKWEEK